MNKKTLRIAGWALGLSMAVTGAGITAGASAKNLIETNATGTTVSKTMVEIATANSWVTASGNGTQTCYTSFNLDSNVRISTTGSANCGSFWGTDWRLYQAQSGTFVVTPLNGVEISSLTITFTVANSGCLSTAEGTSKTAYFGSGTAKDVSISSATTYFVANTASKTNGQVKITGISATYTVPQTISLGLKGESKSAISFGDETTLIATPTGGLTGTYRWSSSVSGVVSFNDADTNEMTFTGANAGSTTITVMLGDKSDTFVITVSRKLNGLTITTTPTKTTYEEGEDFDPTGLVVTADFLGADSDVIPNSNLVFTPSENLNSSVEEIDIAYTESGVTKHVKQAVTVNAPDKTLDSISWAATDISVYSGAELTASDVEAFAVNAHWVESVPDTPLNLGVYTLSIGSTPITAGDLPFALDTAHNGKKLTASYTNNGITKTASVNVTVVETINEISRVDDGASTAVNFVPGTDTGATAVTKGDLTASMTTMNVESYYQIYANQSGTFSVADGKGTITKIEFTCTASGTSKYGPGNASTEVGSYSYSGTKGTWTGSATSVTISSTVQIRMETLAITYTPKVTTIYSNNHYNAQKAALEFADTFNTTMDCDDLYGNTENVVSKWSTLSTAFTTKRTESGDADNYNNLFKYATALEGGDSLQDMLRRYDYIITKYNAPKYNYELPDFLNTSAGRAEAHWALAINTPNSGVGDADNSAILITVASISALVAAGGIFLLSHKRRNED